MLTPYSGHDLRLALDLLDRLDVGGDRHALTALAFRLDGWLAYETSIVLPTGATHAETGLMAYRDDDVSVWLLPAARVLVVPVAPDTAPVETSLVDAAIDHARLGDRIRALVLARFLGDVPLDRQPAARVTTIVAETLDVLPDVGARSRAFLVRALVDGMRPGQGWDPTVARLRTGLERALADHSPDVVDAAAAGLVRLAAGLGPLPPEGDPARGIVVLFVTPLPEVRRAALCALAELPAAALARLAHVLEPHLLAVLADPDPEIRRLAARVQRRLSARGTLTDLVATAETGETPARMAALHEIAALPDADLATLLPVVVDVAGETDARVRDAAREVVRQVATRDAPDLSQRLVLVLLASPDPDLIGQGLAMIVDRGGALDAPTAAAIEGLLDGPAVHRATAAGLLADHCGSLEGDDVARGLEKLLRHADTEVRRTVLRRVAHLARDRAQVRELLFPAVSVHLQDPEPELRVEAALTLVQVGYPNAPGIAAQLAFDPDPLVRRSLAYVLAQGGERRTAEVSARIVGLVDTLFDMAAAGTGDARVHWKAALDALAAEASPRVPEVLAALLARIAPDTTDPFQRFALAEIDRCLVEVTGGGDGLVAICRHLLAPPHRRVEHVARLAGEVAAEEPGMFDLLWTLYAATTGAEAAAARRSLVRLADQPLSAAVRDTVRGLLAEARGAEDAGLLRSLLAAPRA